ncbi:putative transcriptional regulatory protein C1F7.11c [Mycena venus]|uniref:Putative transcriptional regulatory protein C1F7.11c n=1 Tax=Mycena venus TaxID=2733690 RepID=A0A8H7CMP6_9AGAR|nr:putative transcriptional regulatory protein C1F7.11c [Mycena venus]
MAPSPYERPHPQDSRSGVSATTMFELDNIPTKGRTPSKASKRIRGEIACAECRRLKIRCDKTVPCSTCVKRGCGALCPNGTIPPGEGSRFVLAATDHLHQKLTRMEARMHALEDALAILHATDSDKPHPLLLSRDSEDDDDPPEEESTLKLKAVSEEPTKEESALVDALGSLHIDGEGGSRFFGPSGGAESLLLASFEFIVCDSYCLLPKQKAKGMEAQLLPKSAPFPLRELDASYLPPEINQFCNAFPFTPPGIPINTIQDTIETFLPPMERAIVLCETFLEHLSWMFHIVSRRQLIDELIPAIYKQVRVSYGPHELAVLLITLGIGALVDLNLQPYNLEAQHYYRLAQAALSLQSVMTEPSVVTIKTLHLMSIYNGLSGKESNMEASYGFLDMASQVALRTGLHIDPSMWRFEGREAYERRVYFWNLLVAVLWQVRYPSPPALGPAADGRSVLNQSLVTGRPPTILSVFVDCKIPTEEEEYEFGRDGPPKGLGVWGHQATSECLLPIVRATLAVKAPSYEQVLQLDRKIRDFGQPLANQDDGRTAVSMKNFIRSHYRDLMLLFLHRAFFAQVMIENAADPMKSPYWRSVLVAYECACNVLDDTVNQFTKNPLLVARIWRIWSLAFSAAVVIGTLAIRGINLNLDPPPLDKFQIACNMFRNAAETSSRAARAPRSSFLFLFFSFCVLTDALYQQYGDVRVPVAAPDDEITIFGGRAEAVVRSPMSPPLTPPQNPAPAPEAPLPPSRRETLRPPPPPAPNPHEVPQMTIPAPPLAQFDLMGDYAVPVDATRLSQQSWEGLFREAGPAYGLQHDYQMDMAVDGGAMDDRWSSFMHNLDEREPIAYA